MTVAAEALLSGDPSSFSRLVVAMTRKQRVYGGEMALTDARSPLWADERFAS